LTKLIVNNIVIFMERVTEEQLRAAHDGLDSMVYKDLLTQREAEQRQDKLRDTAGCLIREGREFGFSSLTPATCPAEGCSARFNSGQLAVENEASCANPSYQPRDKYPRN
jgi:hypothetical protein